MTELITEVLRPRKWVFFSLLSDIASCVFVNRFIKAIIPGNDEY